MVAKIFIFQLVNFDYLLVKTISSLLTIQSTIYNLLLGIVKFD